MASSPATNAIGIEQQAAGENLNTWGSPKLNQDKQILVNMACGWTTIAVTGNTTISESNYSSSNQTETAIIDITAGAGLVAAFNLVLPNRARRLLVRNSSGYTGTLKLSATTGFALPTGRWTWVGTDGSTDVYNLGANYGGVTSPANSSDVPNWGAVQTAIASAGLPATSGTVLNSGTDTTAGYLGQKVTAKTNGGIAFSTLNGGANEQRQAAVDPTNLTATTNVSASDRFVLYDATAAAVKYQTRANVVGKFGLISQASSATVAVTAGNLYPVDCTSGAGSITFPASASAGDIFGLSIYGTNGWSVSTNSLNYYGVAYTALAGSDEGISYFYYSGASRGWIDA